jgi:hypothetical protein
MYHRLLIAAEVVTKVRVLLQGFPNPGDIAVTENAETAAKKLEFYAIALNVLLFKSSERP